MFSIEELLLKPVVHKTGFPVTVGATAGNALTGRFRLGELEIENPGDFHLKHFVSLVEAKVHLAPSSLLAGPIKIREMYIHVRRVTGVRTASGDVNLQRFREGLERRENSDGKSVERHRRTVHIRRLTIKVDHVATIDFLEAEGQRRDYPLHLTHEFKDVRDLLPVGAALAERCRAAGLAPGEDAIFATILPDFLWKKISGTNDESSCPFEP